MDDLKRLSMHTAFATNDSTLTRAELEALGLTDDEIKWAVRDRDIVRMRRGVYEPPGIARTPERRQRAALRAVGPDGVLSGLAAAGRHGAPGIEPGALEISVRRNRAARLDGVTCHAAPDLADEDITLVGGDPCTTLARTVVDVTAVVHPKALRRIVAFAERRQRPNGLVVIRAAAERVSPKRRPAVAPLLGLLDHLEDGAPDLDIGPRCLAAFARAGIRAPLLELPVRWQGRLNICDAAFLPERVNVEFDDDWSHATVLGSHADKDRDRRARRSGWVVERVHQEQDPDEVAAHVRWLLGQRRAA